MSSYSYLTFDWLQYSNVLSKPVECFSIVSSLYKILQILLFNGIASWPSNANCSGVYGLGKWPGEYITNLSLKMLISNSVEIDS